MPPVLKASDLCDACAEARACALPLRSFGRRRSFAGAIRTIRCHEDIGLMRDVVAQPGRAKFWSSTRMQRVPRRRD